MRTIQRRLAQTNEDRLAALTAGKTKNDNLPAGTTVLSSATEIRLNNLQPVYLAKMNALGIAGFASTNATVEKFAAQDLARMWTSHYYQALNNAIDRGEYPASVRQFFLIDVSDNAVPEMNSEEKVETWGKRVTTGETAMIAAGFTAVALPTAANVKLKVDDFMTKRIDQSNLMDATDLAEGAVQALNVEADKVIRKVWDEVETYYNEDGVENMRNNAAEWGVIYITVGEITQVTFSAIHFTTSAPEQDVKFKIESTGKVYESHNADSVTAETRIVGETIVIAEKPGFIIEQQRVTIIEGQPLAVQFKLEPGQGTRVVTN
jgi:hypothetical protein